MKYLLIILSLVGFGVLMALWTGALAMWVIGGIFPAFSYWQWVRIAWVVGMLVSAGSGMSRAASKIN